MSAHDQLKAAGITPTIDCERAYQLGYAVAMTQLIVDADNDQQKAANADLEPDETTDPRYN